MTKRLCGMDTSLGSLSGLSLYTAESRLEPLQELPRLLVAAGAGDDRSTTVQQHDRRIAGHAVLFLKGPVLLPVGAVDINPRPAPGFRDDILVRERTCVQFVVDGSPVGGEVHHDRDLSVRGPLHGFSDVPAPCDPASAGGVLHGGEDDQGQKALHGAPPSPGRIAHRTLTDREPRQGIDPKTDLFLETGWRCVCRKERWYADPADGILMVGRIRVVRVQSWTVG